MTSDQVEKPTVKKRILMIAYTNYPFDSRVRREAETLAADGKFDLIVLCLKEHAAPTSYIEKNVTVTELDIGKYSGMSGLRYLASYAIFLAKAFWACSARFFRGKLDIIHVHNMPNLLVFAAIIPKLFGKKIVLDMHDSVPDIFEVKFTGGLGILFKLICLEEKVSAWMSDRIICVNHVQKEVTARRGIPSEKIFISMNVPDHRRFLSHEGRDGLGRKEDGKYKLVYHGTMAARLGIDLAIEAVTKLSTRIPGIELHLWGEGDYLNVLYDRCKKFGSEKRVIFHDAVPIEGLFEVLAHMDLGVVPNRRSPATDLMLPVKLMEYVALGIPVVAPRLKAIEYYFNDEMVTYFEPENVDDMAEAVYKIYQKKAFGKSQALKAKGFLAQYGWEKQSQDFINYYLGI